MDTKRNRTTKKQLGQFMTPPELSRKLVESIDLKKGQNILEPSFGEGSFIFAIIDRLYPSIYSDVEELFSHLYGVEFDETLYETFKEKIIERFGKLPQHFNFYHADFLQAELPISFDHIIGNPPFGGTVNKNIAEEDKLDKKYGWRFDLKIKKETYSFFTVKCIESLAPNGQLHFICSNTFLTVSTHKGLRNYLMQTGAINICSLFNFSDETDYPMVWIQLVNGVAQKHILLDNKKIKISDIRKTPNLSFSSSKYIKYFNGSFLSDFIVCSSGMTIGDNDLFLKEVKDGKLTEKYSYHIYTEPMNYDEELYKSRTTVSKQILQDIKIGKKIKKLEIKERIRPITIYLPNEYYAPYNKMNTDDGAIVEPRTYIYWKNDGEAVKTFKKNGRWYLHGIGGLQFFGREGLTWNLISSKFDVKYLPSGFILDSGRPCAFLKDGVDHNELYYIFAWLRSRLCKNILKNVINHTRNIQGKDIERLPYYLHTDKKEIINQTKKFIIGRISEAKYQEYLDSVFS